jgi:poly(3-hydroxybutyrate) depolymerase
MRTGSLLFLLFLGLGCGRLEFGEIDLTFEAKLITGVYTADAKLCLSRPAMIKYAIVRTRFPSDWTVDDLDTAIQSGNEASGVVTANIKNGRTGCNVVTVKVPQVESEVYLYAMAGLSDEEMAFPHDVAGKMNPIFQLETFMFQPPGGAAAYLARYWVHYPEAHYRDTSSLRPTMLYLHGFGSNGNDSGANINKVIEEMPPARYMQSEAQMIDLPFLVIAPQCNQSQEGCFGWAGSRVMSFLDQMLMSARGKAPIDDRQFYVTGSSTGGEGSWRYAIHRPELVDAIIPISTTYSPDTPSANFFDVNICKMAQIPVWAFHNVNDTSQPISNARTLRDKLAACQPKSQQLDEGNWSFPPNGHGGWTLVYGDAHGFTNQREASVYKWLLQHGSP